MVQPKGLPGDWLRRLFLRPATVFGVQLRLSIKRQTGWLVAENSAEIRRTIVEWARVLRLVAGAAALQWRRLSDDRSKLYFDRPA